VCPHDRPNGRESTKPGELICPLPFCPLPLPLPFRARRLCPSDGGRLSPQTP
jgi:hypothetical protein